MRPIKFRLIRAGKIVGYEVWDKGLWLYDESGKTPLIDWNTIRIRHDQKDQFTGLHDRNGKEICDGDTLILDGDKKFSGKVWFDEKRGQFCYDELSLAELFSSDCSVEVIGNRYENPELLTQEV